MPALLDSQIGPNVSCDLPPGKRLHNYGTSPFFMGKSTIKVPFSIAMFVYPEGIDFCLQDRTIVEVNVFKHSRHGASGTRFGALEKRSQASM